MPITKALGKSLRALDLLRKAAPSKLGFSYLKRISTLVWGEELLTLPPSSVFVSTFRHLLASLSALDLWSFGLQNLVSHIVTRFRCPLPGALLHLPGLDALESGPGDGLLV